MRVCVPGHVLLFCYLTGSDVFGDFRWESSEILTYWP